MHFLDLAVILAYLAGITWFGARFRSGQKSLRDYFLGGRTAPWWAIALSIVSAETSTLTIVGTPALAFGGNWGLLQVVLGYLLGGIPVIRQNFEKVVLLIIAVSLAPVVVQVINERRAINQRR